MLPRLLLKSRPQVILPPRPLQSAGITVRPVPLLEGSDPIYRAQPEWPNHLLKALPLNASPQMLLPWDFQHELWRGHKHSHHSRNIHFPIHTYFLPAKEKFFLLKK